MPSFTLFTHKVGGCDEETTMYGDIKDKFDRVPGKVLDEALDFSIGLGIVILVVAIAAIYIRTVCPR